MAVEASDADALEGKRGEASCQWIGRLRVLSPQGGAVAYGDPEAVFATLMPSPLRPQSTESVKGA
jgi:hypothetical protein